MQQPFASLKSAAQFCEQDWARAPLDHVATSEATTAATTHRTADDAPTRPLHTFPDALIDLPLPPET
jgi:hypothetical protein